MEYNPIYCTQSSRLAAILTNIHFRWGPRTSGPELNYSKTVLKFRKTRADKVNHSSRPLYFSFVSSYYSIWVIDWYSNINTIQRDIVLIGKLHFTNINWEQQHTRERRRKNCAYCQLSTAYQETFTRRWISLLTFNIIAHYHWCSLFYVMLLVNAIKI